MFRLLPVLAALVLAAPLAAQAPPAFGALNASASCPTGVDPARDLDGDCLDDDLERSGFDRNLDACTPGTAGCFVTDPLAWSTDGDPYSDFQEATGVNMEATVEDPYRHPLVAAAPQVEVVLEGYQYVPRATITDSEGRSVGTGFETTFSVESTTGASTTVGAEASATGPKVSAEATVSQSLTVGFSASASINAELNWETATTVDADAAAELRLILSARNTGGGTAKNVTPTLNVYVGGELIGTIVPARPFPSNLTPGDELSDPVVVDQRTDGSRTEPILLTLPQLQRLRLGDPIAVRVVGLDAEVERWNSADSNWSCGSESQPCLWESFQDQIDARTLRVSVDYGYSGDPDADIPARYFGNPFNYRVYTGSPSGSAGYDLRDVLGFLGLAEGSGDGFRINGRLFPSQWLAVSGPQEDRQGREFIDHWEAWADSNNEWPRDLLDMPMPRSAPLALISPDPVDPLPVPGTELLLDQGRQAVISVQPKSSIPVVAANAHLFLNGRETIIEMERLGDSDLWLTPDSLSLPAAAGSSYIVLSAFLGNKRIVGPGLTPGFPEGAACSDIPESYYAPPRFGNATQGVVTVFVDGDLDRPATAFCGRGGETYFWVPQESGVGGANLYDVEVIDRDRRVASGTRNLLVSDDGGQTWRVTYNTDSTPVIFRSVAFREGTGVGVAVADRQSWFMRTEDYGETWERIVEVEGAPSSFLDVDHAGGDDWFAVGPTSIRRSEDNGLTWQDWAIRAVDDNGNRIPRAGFANLDVIEFLDAERGIVADPSMSDGVGRIWATADGGNTWRVAHVLDGVADVTFTGDGTRSVGLGRDRVQVYENLFDPAARKQTVEQFGSGLGSPVAVSFGTPEVGFLLLSGEQVRRTEDGGETWASASAFPTNYVTPRDETFMTRIDMLDAHIGVVTGADGRIGGTDSGGGLASYTLVVSNEPSPEAPEVPAVVTLGAPAPNPIRSTARVQFGLGASGRVHLAVYDALGREVATLADGPLAAGEHEATFDATGLAPGGYVVRLRGEDAVTARTVTVVR